MSDFTITKLERDENSVWTARLTFAGEPIPVTYQFGSWGTVPVNGCWKPLPYFMAAALQERVRPIERRERIEAHARGEHAEKRDWQCVECRRMRKGEVA